MSPAPAFEFTRRATPVIQMGRSARRDEGNRWQEGMWGSGRWGLKDWSILWTDLTCEVHEITTTTGRGGATDRFVPGTAAIVASNVNQISEIIFPQVPETGEGIELVPQPPIVHEEELQAPAADTVVSNGWSFSDDFETRPPRWKFPPAFTETGAYPWRPFIWHDGFIAPEMFQSSSRYEAHGVAQWTGVYPDFVEAAVTLDAFNWPSTPTAGTPSIIVDLYANGNITDRACNCARFTLTPVFSGVNTVTVQLFAMDTDGSNLSGGSPTTITAAAGSNGQFPRLTFQLVTNPDVSGLMSATVAAGTGVVTTLGANFADGSRLGFAVHYTEGDLPAGTSGGAPHVIGFQGFDFEDDFTRRPGSGWTTYPKRVEGGMIVVDGALRPPQEFADFGTGRYNAAGDVQWVSEFDGDQFVEVFLTGAANTPSDQTEVTLYAKGNRHNLEAVTAEIQYLPDSPESLIDWRLSQLDARGGIVFDPDVEDESWGEINLGVDGVYPDARWRLEADDDGDVRLYYRGGLIGHALFPDLPAGGRIGVGMDSNRVAAAGVRPPVARIEQLSGGLQSPLGTEELGMWVRIGVDHDTLGQRWLFRGFVDALVPTYVPDRPDAVRIECVDSLGEAGRVFVDGDQLSHPFAMAPTRIFQILNAASWPAHFRTVGDDSTLMSRPRPGKAVDLLTHVAESCGGAVYGDPYTGDVVFKGQDWQGEAAGGEVEAFITNYFPAEDDGILRVCPTGWERSSRRSDMTTRVRFSSVTSDTDDGEPIVREWRYPAAERLYGVEKYERTLICTTRERLDELGIRQLRIRQPNQFPRIEAALLDAATSVEALDLMTTVSFTGPSKVQCQLRRDGLMVFNRKMLVTGVRHRMTPTRWSCRLALDPSSVFVEVGGRWDEARWGHDEWGRTR